MRNVRGYEFNTPNYFKSSVWISSNELFITNKGLLSKGGLRDHFGPGAVKEAMNIAEICDHLRYNHNNHHPIIEDELGRKGLNLAAHPFKFHCFTETMWRFSEAFMRETLPVYGDAQMFYGWAETLFCAVSKRDGQPYDRPSNMFGSAVHTDQ